MPVDINTSGFGLIWLGIVLVLALYIFLCFKIYRRLVKKSVVNIMLKDILILVMALSSIVLMFYFVGFLRTL